MNRCAIVVTHHKTGSTWTTMTFRSIGRALHIPLIDIADDEVRHSTSMPSTIVPPVIVLDRNCRLVTGEMGLDKFASLLVNPDHRLFHMIRDPRDIVVSSVRYHRTSGEKWLRDPRKKYGGLSYQQKLNGFGDDTSRYQFEMDSSSRKVIEAMGKWNYDLPNCFECKYENLLLDTEMTLFSDISLHLGFTEPELEECRKWFWQRSLFGGIAAKKEKMPHIRSGKSSQWRTAFSYQIAREFVNRFGDVLVRLGYEPDNSWVERNFADACRASDSRSDGDPIS